MALMYDHTTTDTIAAIATSMSEAGIGIIRISGPDAAAIGSRLYRTGKKERADVSSWRPGTIRFGYIVEKDENGQKSVSGRKDRSGKGGGCHGPHLFPQ